MDRKPSYSEAFAEVVAVKWMQPLRFVLLTKDAKLVISDMKSLSQGFERQQLLMI
jgi:hypothetical protein